MALITLVASIKHSHSTIARQRNCYPSERLRRDNQACEIVELIYVATVLPSAHAAPINRRPGAAVHRVVGFGRKPTSSLLPARQGMQAWGYARDFACRLGGLRLRRLSRYPELRFYKAIGLARKLLGAAPSAAIRPFCAPPIREFTQDPELFGRPLATPRLRRSRGPS